MDTIVKCRPVRWSTAEIKCLRELYPKGTRDALEKALPNRTWGAILERGYILRLSRTTRAWLAADEDVMRQYYAAEGCQKLAARLGRTVDAVAHKAGDLKLRFVRVPAPRRSRALVGPRLPKPAKALKMKAPKAERVPRIKAEKLPSIKAEKPVRAPKPVKSPKPAVALAVKRSPKTPNLNLQKEARKQKELAPKKAAPITADEIRRLPANHPARHAYAMGGVAGWQHWKAQQAA